jgi:HSP20 family protein
MNLYEDPEGDLATVTIELPGLGKDEVNIDAHDGSLTVAGVITEASKKEEHRYIVRERRCGRFSRTIKLPDGTDASIPPSR